MIPGIIVVIHFCLPIPLNDDALGSDGLNLTFPELSLTITFLPCAINNTK